MSRLADLLDQREAVHRALGGGARPRLAGGGRVARPRVRRPGACVRTGGRSALAAAGARAHHQPGGERDGGGDAEPAPAAPGGRAARALPSACRSSSSATARVDRAAHSARAEAAEAARESTRAGRRHATVGACPPT